MRAAFAKSRRPIERASGVGCKFMAAVSLLGLVCGVAAAGNSRSTYLRMAFSVEGQPVRITACLQVTEHAYPDSAWWEDFSGSADAPERAVKEVVAVIKRKDRAALLRLSHPTLGRDPKRFDEQAGAFFQQFEVLQLVTMPRAYEFDGLVVFFAKFRSKNETGFAPLIFAHEDDGTFGFLPYRTEALTYQLVTNWFNSTWRPPATAGPIYCAQGDIKRATHRISLAPSSGAPDQAWHPSQVFLIGAPLGKPGALAKIAVQAKSTIDSLKSALASGGDFARHMTPEGARRLKEWYASAVQTERIKYAAAVAEQEPFFLFDASPLVVVYTRSRSGVQVMYFTFGTNGELLWTNSSYITVADRVFKQGPLYNAALLEKPFSSVAIK